MYLSSIKYPIFPLETVNTCYETQIHKLFMSSTNKSVTLEENLLSTIDEVLWSFKDGKWHSLTEITEKCSSPQSQVKIAVSFLREYGFIQVNDNERKAKLSPLTLKFIDEIQRVEREEALSHKRSDGTVSVHELEPLRRTLKTI